MEKYLEILPEDIVNKILMCATHPIADLFREEIDKFVDDDDDLTLFSCLYFEEYYFNNHCKKYCGSCEYYYPKVCICCPCCD
jgi:hypothetical protein